MSNLNRNQICKNTLEGILCGMTITESFKYCADLRKRKNNSNNCTFICNNNRKFFEFIRILVLIKNKSNGDKQDLELMLKNIILEVTEKIKTSNNYIGSILEKIINYYKNNITNTNIEDFISEKNGETISYDLYYIAKTIGRMFSTCREYDTNGKCRHSIGCRYGIHLDFRYLGKEYSLDKDILIFRKIIKNIEIELTKNKPPTYSRITSEGVNKKSHVENNTFLPIDKNNDNNQSLTNVWSNSASVRNAFNISETGSNIEPQISNSCIIDEITKKQYGIINENIKKYNKKIEESNKDIDEETKKKSKQSYCKLSDSLIVEIDNLINSIRWKYDIIDRQQLRKDIIIEKCIKYYENDILECNIFEYNIFTMSNIDNMQNYYLDNRAEIAGLTMFKDDVFLKPNTNTNCKCSTDGAIIDSIASGFLVMDLIQDSQIQDSYKKWLRKQNTISPKFYCGNWIWNMNRYLFNCILFYYNNRGKDFLSLEICINHGFKKKKDLNELIEKPFISSCYECGFDPDFITGYGNTKLDSFKNDLIKAIKNGEYSKNEAIYLASSVINEINFMNYIIKMEYSEYNKCIENLQNISDSNNDIDTKHKEQVKKRHSSEYYNFLRNHKNDEDILLEEAITHAKKKLKFDVSQGWIINYTSKKVNTNSVNKLVRASTPTFDDSFSVWNQKASGPFGILLKDISVSDTAIHEAIVDDTLKLDRDVCYLENIK